MTEPATRDVAHPVAWGASICNEFKRILEQGYDEWARAYFDRGGTVAPQIVTQILAAGARHFLLAGVDLMPVVDSRSGSRKMLILEVNSAPGFIYCTPEKDIVNYGYGPVIDLLLEHTPQSSWNCLVDFSEGKTPVEDMGFQHYLGKRLSGHIPIVRPADQRSGTVSHAADGHLLLEGMPISGGIRYLHDRPWTLIPPDAKGTFVNPTSVDLCGGRDKLMAAEAFRSFRFQGDPIPVSTPPCLYARSGGHLRELIARSQSPLVVKKRHLNSGIGIYFIVNPDCANLPEIDEADFPLVVQEMIPTPGMLHAGAGPFRQTGVTIGKDAYACDVRIVLASFADGFRPLMMYARRARLPFRVLSHALSPERLDDALKVNIARKTANRVVFETQRLVLPDSYGWDVLGLSADEVKAAIVESALAVAAVDSWCEKHRGRYRVLMEQLAPGPRPALSRRINSFTIPEISDSARKGLIADATELE